MRECHYTQRLLPFICLSRGAMRHGRANRFPSVLRDSGNYWKSCKNCVLTETRGDLYYSCTCTDDLFGSSTINLSKEHPLAPAFSSPKPYSFYCL